MKNQNGTIIFVNNKYNLLKIYYVLLEKNSFVKLSEYDLV